VRQRDEAEAALVRVGCAAPEEDERPNRLTLPAPRESLVLVEEAAAELRRAGIGVSDMGLRRPTLDDVFLRLTGEAPSENGNPRVAAAVPDEKVLARPRRLPRPRAPSLRGAETSVTDSAVVTVRNLRHFWRQPDLLVFSTIQPIMFVVLFVYVFGGAVGLALPPGVTYVDYLSWIFAFVSLVVRGAETAQTAGFVLLFPLVFASSVFVPVSSMPDWLQPIAEASPVTLTADAARTLALTGGVPDSLWGALAWIVGIVALFVPLSVWRYRRMS
jgi:ABC-2 type transporter